MIVDKLLELEFHVSEVWLFPSGKVCFGVKSCTEKIELDTQRFRSAIGSSILDWFVALASVNPVVNWTIEFYGQLYVMDVEVDSFCLLKFVL